MVIVFFPLKAQTVRERTEMNTTEQLIYSLILVNVKVLVGAFERISLEKHLSIPPL